MYDDTHEASRAMAERVEPLLIRLMAVAVGGRLGDRTQDRLSEFPELGVPLDNMSPTTERQDNRPAIRIDRLPHPSIVRADPHGCKSLLETCP